MCYRPSGADFATVAIAFPPLTTRNAVGELLDRSLASNWLWLATAVINVKTTFIIERSVKINMTLKMGRVPHVVHRRENNKSFL